MELRFDPINWVMKFLMRAISNDHAGHRFSTPALNSTANDLSKTFRLNQSLRDYIKSLFSAGKARRMMMC